MRFIAFLLTISLLSACESSTAATAETSAPSGTPAGEVSLENAENPRIKLTIANAPLEGALLIGQSMDQQFRLDSARVEGNSIIFERDRPYPMGHYFAYFSSGQGVQFLVSNDQTFELTGDIDDPISTMQVAGSEDNRLLYEAMRYEDSLQPRFQEIANRRKSLQKGTPAYDAAGAERDALVAERKAKLESLFATAPNSLFASFKRAGQNPALRKIMDANGQLDENAQVTDFRLRFWDGVDFSDARLLRTPVIKNKLKRYITELTPQNADSIKVSADRLLAKTGYAGKYFEFFANWIALQYKPGESPVMDAEAIHVHMIQNYFTRERATWSDSMTVYGLQQRAETMAHSLIGQQAPDITVPGIDGQPKRLYDLKKPYVVVFMFNPECDHCIEQSPVLTTAYKRLKDELDVYAIALDTEQDKWQNFVKAYNFGNFTNVFDPTNRSIYKTFYVDNTPELYLLDPDRKIVAKNLNASQLEEAIALDKAKR